MPLIHTVTYLLTSASLLQANDLYAESCSPTECGSFWDPRGASRGLQGLERDMAKLEVAHVPSILHGSLALLQVWLKQAGAISSRTPQAFLSNAWLTSVTVQGQPAGSE